MSSYMVKALLVGLVFLGLGTWAVLTGDETNLLMNTGAWLSCFNLGAFVAIRGYLPAGTFELPTRFIAALPWRPAVFALFLAGLAISLTLALSSDRPMQEVVLAVGFGSGTFFSFLLGWHCKEHIRLEREGDKFLQFAHAGFRAGNMEVYFQGMLLSINYLEAADMVAYLEAGMPKERDYPLTKWAHKYAVAVVGQMRLEASHEWIELEHRLGRKIGIEEDCEPPPVDAEMPWFTSKDE